MIFSKTSLFRCVLVCLIFMFHRSSARNLQEFIQSANKYLLVGYDVIFYILLDSFSKLPPIVLGPLRTFKVFLVIKENIWEKKDNIWEDLHFIYMKNLLDYITTHIQHEVNFLFIMTANQIDLTLEWGGSDILWLQ